LKALADLAEKARSKRGDVVKMGSSELDPLRKAARAENPVYAYAVGHAYIHDLVEMEEGTDEDALSMTPDKVRRAQAAIPYLTIAERQGHVGAVRQLARAHKALAEYYHGVSKLEVD
jgi:hypothetical protein